MRARAWESHYTTSQSLMQLDDGSWRIWYASRPAAVYPQVFRHRNGDLHTCARIDLIVCQAASAVDCCYASIFPLHAVAPRVPATRRTGVAVGPGIIKHCRQEQSRYARRHDEVARLRQGEVGHSCLLRRRPKPVGDVGPEARCAGGSSGRVSGDRHERAGHVFGEHHPRIAKLADRFTVVYRCRTRISTTGRPRTFRSPASITKRSPATRRRCRPTNRRSAPPSRAAPVPNGRFPYDAAHLNGPLMPPGASLRAGGGRRFRSGL